MYVQNLTKKSQLLSCSLHFDGFPKERILGSLHILEVLTRAGEKKFGFCLKKKNVLWKVIKCTKNLHMSITVNYDRRK
jgi:hypothetical protein